MLLVRDIRLPLAAGEQEAVAAALKKTRLPRHGIKNTGIAKLSVDARHGRPSLVYTVALELADEGAERSFERFAPYVSIAAPAAFTVHNGTRPLAHSPVVCGFGPAGLFAALLLARQGFRPIVLERGPAMEQRAQAVERFNAAGLLDENANIQFGEGGAGTFSDGKLTTRINDPLCAFVTRTLLAHGAPRDIAYKQKPHIGTDLLVDVVRTLRRQIEEAGGEVRFHAQLEGLRFEGGALAGVDVRDGRTGVLERVDARRAVLACGHSARDTFAVVHGAGVAMEQKPFSVGVRIEHDQGAVNRAQYGDAAAHPALGAADYKLAVHLPDGRSAYTFCMCPGGEVVCAASEEGGVVVNGMSRFARDGSNANAALLVGVGPEDFGSDHPLAGVELQRRMEQAAYRAAIAAGGAAYQAPAQTVGDFLAGRAGGASAKVRPTYARGVAWCDLRECLPGFAADAIAEALPLLDRRLRGFADEDAVMTGVETRSSSPVRIVRDDALQARVEGAPDDAPESGLYPCGEGAGYAGGIVSAAVDGLRVAEAVAHPPET